MPRAWIENLIVFLVAGTVVIAVRAFARGGQDKIAGALTMLPLLTALSVAFLLIDTRTTQVRSVLVSSLLTVPAVAVFVATLWYTLKSLHWSLAFGAAFATWGVCAACMIWLRGRLGI